MSDKRRLQVLCKVGKRGAPGRHIGGTQMPVEVSRIKRHGNSLTVTIPKKILSDIPLKHGDQVAMRVAGAKLIMERIPLEELSRIVGQGDGIDAR